MHHHSLLAEMGGGLDRYREFIVFHSEYIYPNMYPEYHTCWRTSASAGSGG